MKRLNLVGRGMQAAYSSSTSVQTPDRNPKLPNRKLFLNNKWVNSLESGNYFQVVNPTNGKAFTEIPMSCKDDVERAVEAAKQAFHPSSPWRKMDASERGKLLVKLANLIARDGTYFMSLDALEVGKLYQSAKIDIMLSQSSFKYTGEIADKLFGKFLPMNKLLSYTTYEPIGICGLLTAWNYSLLFQSIKLAFSLVSGNVALLKPSQNATLTALHLMELIREAGFPPGVVGLLPGSSQVGDMILDHEGIDCISFTGSTEVGQHIYQKGAKTIRRNILELAGKSACVICDDVDLDEAVLMAHKNIFTNAGQCCCGCSRTYVSDTMYEKFVEKSIALTRAQKLGDPFDPTVSQGPQANLETLNNILKMVEDGKKDGGTIVTGGKRFDREGFFMEPTIFVDTNDDMSIAREEIFGPVQLIMPFKSLDEAIARVNNSKYGLASIIYSKNIDNITKFANEVRAGTIWVNSTFNFATQLPFGGFKKSGLQRELGESGILAFTEEKTVQVQIKT